MERNETGRRRCSDLGASQDAPKFNRFGLPRGAIFQSSGGYAAAVGFLFLALGLSALLFLPTLSVAGLLVSPHYFAPVAAEVFLIMQPLLEKLPVFTQTAGPIEEHPSAILYAVALFASGLQFAVFLAMMTGVSVYARSFSQNGKPMQPTKILGGLLFAAALFSFYFIGWPGGGVLGQSTEPEFFTLLFWYGLGFPFLAICLAVFCHLLLVRSSAWIVRRI